MGKVSDVLKGIEKVTPGGIGLNNYLLKDLIFFGGSISKKSFDNTNLILAEITDKLVGHQSLLGYKQSRSLEKDNLVFKSYTEKLDQENLVLSLGNMTSTTQAFDNYLNRSVITFFMGSRNYSGSIKDQYAAVHARFLFPEGAKGLTVDFSEVATKFLVSTPNFVSSILKLKPLYSVILLPGKNGISLSDVFYNDIDYPEFSSHVAALSKHNCK